MTSRYISALDYADINAKRILKKHAKKRPLGELESRLRYTPAQPVLSCRTVDIDVSGTRTYRSRSTTDIISEQHKLIHTLYTKPSRNIVSAPNRRNVSSGRSDDSFSRRQRINIEVHGRPLTSQSQSSLQHSNRSNTSTRRPKTTGNLKKSVSFLSQDLSINRNNSADLIETSREHRKLTDKIHEHWDPGNHDLNTGTFVRGQQKSEAPPNLESGWLTFGGVNSEEASGVIDAFAELKDDEEYYNIEGKVGSRVAQQLQKGDKIRVGINGRIQSDNLRVKRQDSCLSRESEVDKADKENMEKSVIPLCWEDELSSSKVISPREQKDNGPKPVVSETHPVYFKHEKNEMRRPILTTKSTKQNQPRTPEGFKIKHRKKSRQSLDGQEDEKIMVITIDQKSQQEESKLQGLSVDDVLKNKLNGNKVVIPTDSTSDMEISTVQDSPRTFLPAPSEETPHNMVKSNLSETALSVESLRITTPKSKPLSPQYVTKSVPSDLSVGPSSGNLAGRVRSASSTGKGASDTRSSRGSDRGSAKHHNRPTPPKPLHTFNSPSSFNVYGTRGETEFIQITSQIRNPNPPPPVPHSSPLKDSYISQSYSDEAIRQVGQQNAPVTTETHQPVPAPSPEIPDNDSPKAEEDNDALPTTPQPDIRTASPGSTGLAISIPTAEEFSDKDSAVNSPWTSQRESVDNNYSATSKREAAYRDSQIDQLTSLLKGAIVVPTDKENPIVIEKSVKFQEGS